MAVPVWFIVFFCIVAGGVTRPTTAFSAPPCELGVPGCCEDDDDCDDEDACNGEETCEEGTCDAGTPLACDDGNPCTADSCNPASGCVNAPVNDGTSCADDDACNGAETCRDGTCDAGTPVACTAPPPCRTAVGATCDPTTGACTYPALPNGTSCSDGDACNGAETCRDGTCDAGTPLACDDGNPCTADSCNPASGCRHELVTGCTLCTSDTQCNDGNPCTADSCDNGRCVNAVRPDGFACNDGNTCTLNDTCQAGVCTGGATRTCNDNNACTADSCDPQTGCEFEPIPDCTPCTTSAQCNDDNPCTTDACTAGRCVNRNRDDGSPCNDGNACTRTDTCQAGICKGSNPVVCTPKDQCHDAGDCDPATGQCSTPPKRDDTPCDDGNACTRIDSCRSGICTGSEPRVCNDDNPCTRDTCNPALGCEYPPVQNGTPCDDGSLCTRRDECRAGVCTGTDPVICPGLDPCEPGGLCDPMTGRCSTEAQPDGTPCDDKNPCTQTDVCKAGACTGTDPVVCTPKDQCHDAGTCDPATGRCSDPPKPNGANCDDGDRCTQTDTCRGGSCVGRDPVVCTAKDQCHRPGVCDPATGICSDPPQLDGTTCDDGNPCTRRDRCRTGACTGEDPVVCVSDNECESPGICDPATGRCPAPQPRPDGTPCRDDGATCTDDRCRQGQCVHVRVDERCTPSDPCSTAVCFPQFPTADPAGCVAGAPAPDGGECTEDADPCTDDRCRGGICRHENVPERRFCEPVDPAWRRALRLATDTSSFAALAAASVANGSLKADRWPTLAERLSALAGDAAIIERTLAGRIPVPDGKDTVAGRRARAVLPIVTRRLIPGWRAVVKELKTAEPSRARGARASATVRDRARALLADAKALKRDLKRLQRISRVFAR